MHTSSRDHDKAHTQANARAARRNMPTRPAALATATACCVQCTLPRITSHWHTNRRTCSLDALTHTHTHTRFVFVHHKLTHRRSVVAAIGSLAAAVAVAVAAYAAVAAIAAIAATKLVIVSAATAIEQTATATFSRLLAQFRTQHNQRAHTLTHASALSVCLSHSVDILLLCVASRGIRVCVCVCVYIESKSKRQTLLVSGSFACY